MSVVRRAKKERIFRAGARRKPAVRIRKVTPMSLSCASSQPAEGGADVTKGGGKLAAGKLREMRGKGAAQLRQLRGKHEARHDGGDGEEHDARQMGQESGRLMEQPLIGPRAEGAAGLEELIQTGAESCTESVRQTSGQRVEAELDRGQWHGDRGKQRRDLAQEAAQLAKEHPAKEEQGGTEERKEQECAEKAASVRGACSRVRAEGDGPLGQKGNQKSDQKRQQHRQQKAHEQKDTERGGEDAQAGGPKGS